MKSFKAMIALVGVALCLSACPKNTTNDNIATDMNAATNDAGAAAVNALNAADNSVNAAGNAVDNASAALSKAASNGERTDTGPRGNPGG